MFVLELAACEQKLNRRKTLGGNEPWSPKRSITARNIATLHPP